MTAVLTGSHAYGLPRVDSDVDLVVLVSKDDLKTLALLADQQDSGTNRGSYDDLTAAQVRFGNLNLILCTDERDFETWRSGTEALREHGPVTRDQAVALFRCLRSGGSLAFCREALSRRRRETG